jgi:hypothetical protein
VLYKSTSMVSSHFFETLNLLWEQIVWCIINLSVLVLFVMLCKAVNVSVLRPSRFLKIKVLCPFEMSGTY